MKRIWELITGRRRSRSRAAGGEGLRRHLAAGNTGRPELNCCHCQAVLARTEVSETDLRRMPEELFGRHVTARWHCPFCEVSWWGVSSGRGDEGDEGELALFHRIPGRARWGRC